MPTTLPNTAPIVYGISNCDTMKRARAWLDQAGISHDVHDYKKAGVPLPALEQALASLGWEALVNRAGTTWRKLDETAKGAVVDAASALALMQAQPSVIKRPLVHWGAGRWSVGFKPEQFEALRSEAAC